MKNLKVSAKLLLGFGLVVALALMIGVVGIIGLTSMSNASDDLYTSASPLTELAGARESFQTIRGIVWESILFTGEVNEINRLKREFESECKVFEDFMSAYDDSISDEVQQGLFDSAMKVYNNSVKPGFLSVINSAGQGVDMMELHSSVKIADEECDLITADLDELMSLRDVYMDDVNATNVALGDTLLIVIIGVVLAALAIAVFLALYISSLISKPITTIANVMLKMGTTGNLDLNPEDARKISALTENKDEMGKLSNGASSLVTHITKISKELESVAGGDLTIDVKLLSDSDTMGKSMEQMVVSLNNMFAEINSSASQVSTGSKQVADGAQSLAQGATEQAASIQQLSASIGEIAERTKDNAATADRTAKLSGTIKENAEKGSRQMDEMITAVSDINEASKNISKIIKTIDDIAFQTNILALNAAVEAARAGQHGKGFAVVAEEVRNLASKSAEAAKNTGDMIQNSMEKAELGSRIAGETAASLSEIVTGINESSNLITEIADSSENQSIGISQINTGIDQVAQVVQQNSATAEQSAAASEEMSGQSDMLQQLIAQFKLKDMPGVYTGLPAKSPTPKQLPVPKNEEPSIPDTGGDFGKY